MKRRISIIVAVAENGVIGRHGDLPWRLSADLKRFKRLTMGHPIVMGRKTYDSIGRPLPGRRSIVISRQPAYRPDGVLVVSGFDAALAASADDEEVFVIGGAEIYRLALPTADRLYLTRVHAEVDGDIDFPTWDADRWTLVSSERHAADDKNQFDHSFQILDRKRPV